MTLLLLLAVLFPQTTYYVAKTGNDSTPGTFAEPWLTINHAVTQVQTGDRVMVRAGSYAEDIVFNGAAGTAAAPIVFKSYDGRAAVLFGTIVSQKDYYGLEDFTITLPNTQVRQQAIKFDANNNWVTGCSISPAIPHNDSAAIGVLWGSGYYWGNKVSRNRIHGFGKDGHGNAIYANHARGAIITYNVITDCERKGIQAYPDVRHCEIAYNSCTGTHTSPSGDGILVEGDSNDIHHNLSFGNGGHGIRVSSYEAPSYANRVWNNVLVGNSAMGLYLSGDGRHSAFNNIIMGNEWEEIQLNVTSESLATVLTDYNCFGDGEREFCWNGIYGTFAEYRAATGNESHGMAADPQFVDTTAHDYHLRKFSPCIDAGDPETPQGYDFDGVPTPQGWGFDIGAYERPHARRVPRRWRKMVEDEQGGGRP